MLLADLYRIEYNLQELANNLANKFPELKINTFVNKYKSNFYFVNKSNFIDYFKSGSAYYYKQKGYFNYGLHSDYYYNCNRDTIVRFIKNKCYYIHDYETLIGIVSSNIANKKDNKKIYIVLDKKLFEHLLTELRIKIKSLIDSNNIFSNSELTNLYPIYTELLDKFVFYVVYQEYEIFNLFYKDFTISIGYNIDIYVYNTKINITEYLNKYVTIILKLAKKLFNRELNQTKFLFIETDYIKYDNYIAFLFTFVFKMYNIKQLIQASILNSLYKYL